LSLRKLAREFFNKSIGLVGASEEPYSSHVSVLIQLAQSLKPHRVAEFGMGHFSTSVFLDRTLFPSVELLTSFEDDPEWFSLMTQKHPPDSRFEARLVSPPMWKAARKLRASDYDLIFVDDSKSDRDRAKTLLALRLAQGITKGPVVVVHDVNLPRIRAMTLIFPNRRYFRDSCPQTGVFCWKARPKLSAVTTDIEVRG
jgi:predicted O-methyltransferase YrrM